MSTYTAERNFSQSLYEETANSSSKYHDVHDGREIELSCTDSTHTCVKHKNVDIDSIITEFARL